jgi:DNA repair protein RadC
VKTIPVYDVKLVRSRKPLHLAENTAGDGEMTARILHTMLGASDREQFVCIFLNARHEVTGVHVAAVGAQNTIGTIDARTILRAALAACAAGMVVGHNHPSGDPRPSKEDLACTASLCKAANIVGIPIVDHVIVTRDQTKSYSFYQHGDMPKEADAK